MSERTGFTRLDPDATRRIRALGADLGALSMGLTVITLQAGERTRIDLGDRQELVLLVVEGCLDLEIDDRRTALDAHELLRLAGSTRPRLANRGPRRVVLLAIDGTLPQARRDPAGAPVDQLPLPIDPIQPAGSTWRVA